MEITEEPRCRKILQLPLIPPPLCQATPQITISDSIAPTLTLPRYLVLIGLH